MLASYNENTDLEKIIKENNLGIFCPANNTDILVNAIRYLYDNPEICKTMGAKGREFAKQVFAKEIGTKKYISVFQQAVKTFKEKGINT